MRIGRSRWRWSSAALVRSWCGCRTSCPRPAASLREHDLPARARLAAGDHPSRRWRPRSRRRAVPSVPAGSHRHPAGRGGHAARLVALCDLRTYRDGSGGCTSGSVRAARGHNGFARSGKRRQDTGKTPAGTYAVLRAFGNGDGPGDGVAAIDSSTATTGGRTTRATRAPTTSLQYHGRSPSTRWRKSWAEDLSGLPRPVRATRSCSTTTCRPGCYRASGEPARSPRAGQHGCGGGIFLHVNGRGSTAGCVSVGAEGHAQDRPLARPRASTGDRDGAEEGDRPRPEPADGLAVEPVSRAARRACRAAAARPWCASGRCGSR